MHDLSRIAHMEPSPIRRIYEKAITMDDIIFFSIGEPDFKTPDAVIETAVASMRAGETHYTSNAGIADLRAAVSENLLSYDKQSPARIIVRQVVFRENKMNR